MMISYSKLLKGDTAELLNDFAAKQGRGFTRSDASRVSYADLDALALGLNSASLWAEDERTCIRFLFAVSKFTGEFSFLYRWVGPREEEVLRLARESGMAPDLDAFAARSLRVPVAVDWTEAEDGTAGAPFRSAYANHGWQHGELEKGFFGWPGLISAVIRWRPELLEQILADPKRGAKFVQSKAHLYVLEVTDRFDDAILAIVESELKRIPVTAAPFTSESGQRKDYFLDYWKWNERRGGRWHDRVLELAMTPEFAAVPEAVALLLAERPDDVLKLVAQADRKHLPWGACPAYQELIKRCLADFGGTGGRILADILKEKRFTYSLANAIHRMILADPGHPFVAEIRQVYLAHAATLKGKKLADFWEEVGAADAGLFEKEWREMASAKGQQLRTIGARWLATKGGADLSRLGREMASSTNVDERIGGATLLAEAGDPASIDRLKELHATETSKQVREELAKLLEKLGHAVAAEPKKPVATFTSFADFERSLSGKTKGIRLPTAPWLKAAKLPALHTRQGDEVGELARSFLFQRQARERGGVVSEDVEPLLAHLDRSKNAAFAHALLDQWFASDMKASSRWALDVAGLTGDDTILDRLVQPIPQWCKQNAGKRAEWAVHAIALIGSPAALRMLDALTHRYRSQRKYVGAAASEAIRTLAAVQGISEDEIAERIVPDFGFDAACQRIFPSKSGGSITAKLRPDFKIVWQSGDGKETASAPTGLTTADETEARGMAKLLREALKSQKLRLEMAMVEGRRWPVETWKERFEKHPLFRLLAESLVWSVHDPDGKMLRTFRRYPNGILADANGEPEEFEGASSVGLPHPVNLDEATLAAWGAHLKRFKVKSPLAQIDRPVARPDALHGNRRELRLAEGKELDAAELRSRIIGQGWTLGSTQYGGSIYDCFRKFQGLQLEAYLALEDFHAMSGRGDVVKTGSALIARSDPDRKRSHLGTMPESNDPRVLRFDQVPAVVWSETMSDLKAILGV